jgi:putative peptidoglycan lipid II flippase
MDQTTPAPSPQQDGDSAVQVARSTLVVVGGLAASFVIGPVRQGIISNKFGTSAALDAYTAANSLSELLVATLAYGTLTFAFMPVYAELLAGDGKDDANRLFSQVVTLVFVLAGLAAAVAALLAPTLVGAPGWGIGQGFPPDIQRLTVQLIRILLFSTIIFAASGILTGTLHVHQHFLLPALAPVVYSGGIIFGALALAPSMGIFGLAWGAVIGAAFHLLIQVPGLIGFRVRWRPVFDWHSPTLGRVFVLMAPRVVDLLMARISIGWLNGSIGSALGEGRVSALGYAYQLMNIPWTLVGTAIGFAIFPTMTKMAARKDVDAQRKALSGALRAIFTLSIPAAVGMIMLGRPLIRLLFERGEFTTQSTELVFYALQFYMVFLLGQSMLDVIVRAFAAQQDTLTPLLVSFFTTALNIGLAIWLSRPIAAGGLEHGGLALANGVAVTVESLTGLTILHFRWRGVDARRILVNVGKAGLAAAVMGGVLWAFQTVLQPGALIAVVGGGALGVGVYFAVALALGIEEIRTIPMALIRRFLDRGRTAEAYADR